MQAEADRVGVGGEALGVGQGHHMGAQAFEAGGQSPETRLDLETAIRSLPAGARVVFVLHDVEGYGHEEIAAMTGLSTGTSKSQLHRARGLLRARLSR